LNSMRERRKFGAAGSRRSSVPSSKAVCRAVMSSGAALTLAPETPPGAQAQVDWGEFSDLDVGEGPQKLYASL
jgi:hypothetical protein